MVSLHLLNLPDRTFLFIIIISDILKALRLKVVSKANHREHASFGETSHKQSERLLCDIHSPPHLHTATSIHKENEVEI